MKITRVIETSTPVDRVYAYLSDFTTTNEWDPGTVETVRVAGDGGVGSRYRNTSSFMGRKTKLTYVVREVVPDERLRAPGRQQDPPRGRHDDLRADRAPAPG